MLSRMSDRKKKSQFVWIQPVISFVCSFEIVKKTNFLVFIAGVEFFKFIPNIMNAKDEPKIFETYELPAPV